MKIQTNLSSSHIHLINIFFEANEFKDVNISIKNSSIEIEYDEESESAQRISYMSLIHSGFHNMLDSYLIHCGVSPFELNPPTYHSATDEEVEQHFKKIGLRS